MTHKLAESSLYLVLGLIVVGLLAFLFVPGVQGLFRSSRTVTLPPSIGARAPSSDTAQQAQTLDIVTVLGRDAIPAILAPRFATLQEADAWLQPDSQVLGLSINGDHRAYPLATLSRHEIVNDLVGGQPVAVTW